MRIDNCVPPQSRELEESVLVSCLLNYNEEPLSILTADDFYCTSNKNIFEAVGIAVKKFGNSDISTVIEVLRSEKKLEETGGSAYVSQLIDNAPCSVSIKHHCEIIKSKAILRKVIETSHQIIGKCQGAIEFEEVLDFAQNEMLKISPVTRQKTSAHISDIIQQTIETIEARGQSKNAIIGIPTGLTQLDYMTAGFQTGDLIILAARPSMGKTALAWQMLENSAKSGYPGLLLELEMTKGQLGMRSIARESRIDFGRLRIGKLDRDDWSRVAEASSKISELPIVVDDQSGLTISDVKRKIRNAIKEIGCKIVFIDYLQLMRNRTSGSRENEIGEISRELKTTAKDFNVPIVALSQLNRKLEERSDKHPILSDLRDSGSLEQDADTVIFIYRDEVYNKDENNPARGTAELIVAKQRNGPIGFVPLVFMGQFMSFENCAGQQVEQMREARRENSIGSKMRKVRDNTEYRNRYGDE